MKKELCDNSSLGAVHVLENAWSQSDIRACARLCLSEIKERHPGKTVEVRIPYCGAIQCVQGSAHRRGTPPHVVEMSAVTFLALCLGELPWEQGIEEGVVMASGTKADISDFFPLFSSHVLEKAI
ncbi:MAG: hypothetical protein J6M18_03415 [Actinomycetaceae bacterium]|nr:hypothetical protein [Actinomycetaceae bacterium]